MIARFERKGLSLVALKLMTADEEIANEHYAEHTEKPFFGELVEFITGGPLVALVLEGPNAVEAARQVIGATDPIEADAGSIRGEYGTEVTFNLVHGSDSDGVGRARDRHLVPGALGIGRSRLALAAAAGRCWRRWASSSRSPSR